MNSERLLAPDQGYSQRSFKWCLVCLGIKWTWLKPSSCVPKQNRAWIYENCCLETRGKYWVISIACWRKAVTLFFKNVLLPVQTVVQCHLHTSRTTACLLSFIKPDTSQLLKEALPWPQIDSTHAHKYTWREWGVGGWGNVLSQTAWKS